MTLLKTHYSLGIPGYFNLLKDTKEFITGVEYEIESIRGFGGLQEDSRLSIVDDHSLRNNGKEIKTPPMTYKEQLETFSLIHKSLKLGPDPFSNRTSIHVHVNVRELSMDQVRQLVLTYALLEPLFFSFVGETRKNSIFCVPLNYTYLPSIYKLPIQGLVDKWHKYTAFNILPVATFGTVEFRHMYGTGDATKFEIWLKSLKELYEYVVKTEDFNLIQSLEKGLTFDIAIEALPTLSSQYSKNSIINMLSDTLLDVKLSVGGLK